jgi:hypothetical protein
VLGVVYASHGVEILPHFSFASMADHACMSSRFFAATALLKSSDLSTISEWGEEDITFHPAPLYR